MNAPMPENGVAENNDWVFMGYTQEEAKKNAMNHKTISVLAVLAVSLAKKTEKDITAH